MGKRISLEMDDAGIARLAMQDETNKNLFSDDFIHELVTAMEKAEEMKPKVMVISGLQDVFAAGAEKKNLMDLCDGKVHVKDLLISERIVHASFPVIAAMEGHAVGGGLVMAACCDMVLAARESRYGVVFMGLGFTPGMGCTKLLQGLAGPQLANEMMFTAKRFRGSELANMWHNFNYILPRAEIIPKATSIAQQIAEKNRDSIYLLKYAVSAEKKKLLIEARVQEDYMHRITFAFPETRRNIEELYAGG